MYQVRLPPELHETASFYALSNNITLNQLTTKAIEAFVSLPTESVPEKQYSPLGTHQGKIAQV